MIHAAKPLSVLAAAYGNATLRFAVLPKDTEELKAACFLQEHPDGEASWQTLSVQADSEGTLRASHRKLKLYYSPPTGRFKLRLPEDQTLTGTIQTGRFSEPGFLLHLEAQDRIFGFGAATGSFDKNASCFRLLNLDTLLFTIPQSSYSSLPFFWIQRQGHFIGILVNTSHPLQVDVQGQSQTPGQSNLLSIRPIQKETLDFDLVVFSGSPAQILERYTELTGRPFLPPLWSLGLHQSRWSYKTAERVHEIAHTYRELELPGDAIHLDIHYMHKYRVFTWNRSNFPDPKLLHEKLKKLNFKTVAIVDPGVAVAEDYPVYERGLEKRAYCRTSEGDFYVGRVWPGKTVFPDFSIPKVRAWWAEEHQPLFEAGVSGIWNDMNDPVLKMGKNYDPLQEDIRHQSKSHAEFRNLYANYEAEATIQAFQKFQPEERPFVLTRSASCGIQKHAALWTGDNQSNWKHLRENLMHVINLGLSGVPFCGADVGGFAGDLPLPGMLKALKLRRNRELFARWIELGSLMPFFRIHSAIFTFQQDPWSFGQEVLEICRKHIRRRYRLLPYIYTLFCDSVRSGAPIVRPLLYEYPEWTHEQSRGLPQNAGLIETQFLLGDSLLAAPVLAPKQKKRAVLLPPGEWIEYESGRIYEGGRILELPVTLDYYPLFVKAGAALPVWPTVLSTEEGLTAPLIWELYPGKKIRGRAILDDGKTRRPVTRGFTEVIIEGKRLHSGDIQLSQSFPQRDVAVPSSSILLRTPEEYRTLLISKASKSKETSSKKSRKRTEKSKEKQEGRMADTLSEDRRFPMMEFELGWEETQIELPYRSGHF